MHLVRTDADQTLSIEQRNRRDALEMAIDRLRQSRSKRPVDDYYVELEVLLRELARIYKTNAKAPPPWNEITQDSAPRAMCEEGAYL